MTDKTEIEPAGRSALEDGSDPMAALWTATDAPRFDVSFTASVMQGVARRRLRRDMVVWGLACMILLALLVRVGQDMVPAMGLVRDALAPAGLALVLAAAMALTGIVLQRTDLMRFFRQFYT